MSLDLLNPNPSTITEALHQVAQLLYRGEIGPANSLYAQWVTRIIECLDQAKPEQKRDGLRFISVLMGQQRQEDWVGMADSLHFTLAPLLAKAIGSSGAELVG